MNRHTPHRPRATTAQRIEAEFVEGLALGAMISGGVLWAWLLIWLLS